MNSSMVQQPVGVGVAERFSPKNNKTSKYTVGANHDSPERLPCVKGSEAKPRVLEND